MRITSRRLVVIGLLVLLAGCARGAQALSVQDAWARPGNTGEASAIYFTIHNPQAQDDSLLEARCDAASTVQVHRTQTDAAGKSAMMHQASVPVPAGQQVKFAPGGLHVMMMGLTRDLVPGQAVQVTLIFQRAGEMQVTATVREP